MLSGESIHAQTGVVSNTVYARSTILARHYKTQNINQSVHHATYTLLILDAASLTGSAIVRINETVPTLVSASASAMIRSVGVLARGPIPARRAQQTLVNILITQPTGPSDIAMAREVHIVTGRGALASVFT